MDRTNADGSIASLYADRNLSIGRAGTLITARDKNLTQEEICNVIEFTGTVLDENDDEQLRKAVQYLVKNPSELPEYSANPTTSVQAARKAYVDAREAAANSYADSLFAGSEVDYTAQVKRLAGNVAANNFKSQVSPSDNNWRGICWSPELGLFAIVADNLSDTVATSPDGINWTARICTLQLRAVCWSPELGLFCAVGSDTAATSPDGINWTARAMPGTVGWRGVTWSPELGLFCAVASTGSDDRISTSPDGINWTARAAPVSAAWASVAWSPELALFCAVATGGTGAIITSPDGINWTARTSALSNQLCSVCWSPELALFCIVGDAGAIMTSPDGINWTARIPPSALRLWAVCWSPELRLFCAVTIDDDPYQITTSPDGINWTLRANPANKVWSGICWSPERWVFCAVAGTGSTSGNLIMRTEPVVL